MVSKTLKKILDMCLIILSAVERFWSSNHFLLAHKLLEAVFFHNVLKVRKILKFK